MSEHEWEKPRPMSVPTNPDDLSDWLHREAGHQPCITACTHLVDESWSLLGVANVLRRYLARASGVPSPETEEG